MNDRFLKATGLSVGAFVILIAANGRAFFDALAGFPALIQAWSAALPLGVWSALLALLLAMLAWGFALRYLHPRPDGRSPQLGADVLSILMAIAVTVSQVVGQPAAVLLQAMWMGAAAGFLAPVLCRMVSSIKARAAGP
jgi:hypothetical protein